MKPGEMDVILCAPAYPDLPMEMAWEGVDVSNGNDRGHSTPFLGVPRCFAETGSAGDAPADMLNKQGGADSRPFGVLLITFNV